jgi:hypothetical protein
MARNGAQFATGTVKPNSLPLPSVLSALSWEPSAAQRDLESTRKINEASAATLGGGRRGSEDRWRCGAQRTSMIPAMPLMRSTINWLWLVQRYVKVPGVLKVIW